MALHKVDKTNFRNQKTKLKKKVHTTFTYCHLTLKNESKNKTHILKYYEKFTHKHQILEKFK